MLTVTLERRWLEEIREVKAVDLTVGYEDRGAKKNQGEKKAFSLGAMIIPEKHGDDFMFVQVALGPGPGTGNASLG